MPATSLSGVTNCTLSYARGGTPYSLKLRCRGIQHGFSVIASESTGRKYRAFYPHQRAVDPFAITLELAGYTQYQGVMQWLIGYMNSVVGAGSVSMTVNVPARNFLRQGVPTGGVMDMDQTGSNLFLPQIVFESVTDPLDTSTPLVSGVDLGSTPADDAAQFFYPVSASVNDPNATANSFYDSAPLPTPAPAPNPNQPVITYQPNLHQPQ
jgi:hypothetical protein